MDDVTGERKRRFTALYEGEYAAVLGFVKRRCLPPDAAEDVTHEAFLTAWRRFDVAPIEPGPRRGWLFTIARNCLLNHQRGERRRGLLQGRLNREPLDLVPPSDEAVGPRLDLAKAWASLTAAERELLALTAIDNLTSQEAGQVLGITATAYRHRLAKARKALRDALPAAQNGDQNDQSH